MSKQSGYAGASGEHTTTDVRRTAGGGVSATSSASSGGRGPQQREHTVLQSTTDFGTMKTSELKLWLQQRGADVTGVLERRELEDVARSMGPGTGGASAPPAGGQGPA